MRAHQRVVGREGLSGVVEESVDPQHVRVRFDNRESVILPVEMLQQLQDGTARVPLGPADLGEKGKINHPAADASAEGAVIPVVEERLDIHKKEVETGRVAVYLTPREHEEIVRVPLTDEHVEVRRVEVNRFVEAPEPVRQQGDVTIVPVMEEVLVVQKRLRVKHELHLIRRRETREHAQRVTLRSEKAHVLRSPTPPEATARAAQASSAPAPAPPAAGEPGTDVAQAPAPSGHAT